MERNALCPCGSTKKYKKCCLDLSPKKFKSIESELEKEITLPSISQEIPLELLEEFIENGLVQDEIPFELIAKEYPKLLEDWYPGYPGYPRMATKEDPFCVDGKIEGEFLILYDIPGIDKLPISLDVEKEFGVGECRVWLKKGGASWVATLQKGYKPR